MDNMITLFDHAISIEVDIPTGFKAKRKIKNPPSYVFTPQFDNYLGAPGLILKH